MCATSLLVRESLTAAGASSLVLVITAALSSLLAHTAAIITAGDGYESLAEHCASKAGDIDKPSEARKVFPQLEDLVTHGINDEYDDSRPDAEFQRRRHLRVRVDGRSGLG